MREHGFNMEMTIYFTFFISFQLWTKIETYLSVLKKNVFLCIHIIVKLSMTPKTAQINPCQT